MANVLGTVTTPNDLAKLFLSQSQGLNEQPLGPLSKLAASDGLQLKTTEPSTDLATAPADGVGGLLKQAGLSDPGTGLPNTGNTPGEPAPTLATNPLGSLRDIGRPTVESRQMRMADEDYDSLAKKQADYAQPAHGILGHIGHLLRPSLAFEEAPIRARIQQDESGLRDQAQINNVANKELDENAEKATPEYQEKQASDLAGTKAKTRLENVQADNAEAGKFTIEKTATGLVRVNAATGEAQPVTQEGKPVGVPIETELATYVPVGGSKPHTFLVSKVDGAPIKDLGEHYEKPTTVNVDQGTWALGIDPTTGKPAMFNSKTGEVKAGPEGFTKPTGTQQDTAFRAQIGDGIRDKLLTELQDPAIRSQIGPLLGRAKNYEEFIGNLPANLAEFGQDLNSYAAFQAGLHPVKGIGALEYFDKKIGGLGQNPEQLEGKLRSGAGVAKDVERLAGNHTKPEDTLPEAAVKQLKEGTHTTFGNGQVWTKKNGKPERIS